MPPLLCPSPTLLDQSRERQIDELRRIGVALGIVVENVSDDVAHIVLTPVLREVVADFAQQPWKHHGLMQDIYRLLAQWFLQKHNSLVELDVSRVAQYDLHPIPRGCKEEGWLPFWSDELGRLMAIHNECGPRSGFSIGVACDYAFAGEPVGAYEPGTTGTGFPLVGPQQVRTALSDAYEWEIDENLIRAKVSLRAAKTNCYALGASEVLKPRGGSHYKIVFPGRPRNWTLSRNDNPVPVRYLRELCDITGYPLAVIRYTLLTGVLPQKKLRFCRYLC